MIQWFIFIQRFYKCFPFRIRGIVIWDDRRIIMLQIRVLKMYNVWNRITNTKTYQHQRHTSCNSKDRHEQTFFITEQISKRRFPGKIQMFPQNRYPLQKDSFPFFRCRWTHQWCRCLCQRMHTRKNRCTNCTDQCRHGSKQCIFQFIMYLKVILHIVIHNSIRLDNYKRNDLFTDQDTDNTASCRRQKCIT